MLLKVPIQETPDNFAWFDIYSDTEGKAVLQVETGDIYGCVTMREDDTHTYVECDDPYYETTK